MATITKIFHVDHGVSPETLQRVIDLMVREQGRRLVPGLFIYTRPLPEGAPSVENALYGPKSGDAPVAEDRVFYAKRSEDRPESRMIDLPKRLTRTVTVIGVYDPAGVTVYTVYGGPAAEREPGDASLKTDAEKQAAIDFWSVHALAAR